MMRTAKFFTVRISRMCMMIEFKAIAIVTKWGWVRGSLVFNPCILGLEERSLSARSRSKFLRKATEAECDTNIIALRTLVADRKLQISLAYRRKYCKYLRIAFYMWSLLPDCAKLQGLCPGDRSISSLEFLYVCDRSELWYSRSKFTNSIT